MRKTILSSIVFCFLISQVLSQQGNSLNFDGVNDYIPIPSLSFCNNSDYTIEGWFKSSSASTLKVLVDGNQPNTGNTYIYVEIQFDGTLRFLHRVPAGNTGGISIFSSSFVNDGYWHHFAAVKNSDDKTRLYIDGILEATSSSIVTNIPEDIDLNIGRNNTGIRYMDGNIDDLRFWSDARTLTEIVDNKDIELTGGEQDLANYYKFNQGVANDDNGSGCPSGTPCENELNDDTGNGNSGNLQNFTLNGSTSNWVMDLDPFGSCSISILNVYGVPIADGTYSSSDIIYVSGEINAGANVTFQANKVIYNASLSIDPGANVIIQPQACIPTITIGTQTWMANNLDVGTMITGTTNMTNNSILEKYCYNNDPANCTTYGALYQWDEMMQYVTTAGTQGVCPTGFHLPTDDEWKTLEMHLGMTQAQADATGFRGTDQGSQLAGDEPLWTDNNLDQSGAFGSSGFTALPGGFRDTSGSFGNQSDNALFWSSSESGGNAWDRILYYNDTRVARLDGIKSNGFSVRCVQD